MGGMGGFPFGPADRPATRPLKPGQTRNLPTRLVSLNAPAADGRIAVPAKGEPLRIGDISQLTDDAKAQATLRRLAETKAPPCEAQLVVWRVIDGLDWATIGRLAHGWANPSELALARRFVDQLEARGIQGIGEGEVACLDFEVIADETGVEGRVAELRKLLSEHPIVGLRSHEGVPAHPTGLCLGCRVRLKNHEADVQVAEPGTRGGTGRSSVGRK